MRKKYLLFFLFVNVLCFSQNFDSFASGIMVNTTIYNVTGSDPIQMINPDPGASFFQSANLGTFGPDSGCSAITGAEVKTWKNMTGNVCSVTLHWRVYEQSAIPAAAFNQLSLSTVNECNTGTNVFDDGLGPCQANDQKWKNYSLNAAFATGLVPGSYILEAFFEIRGSDINNNDCETTRFIRNTGPNFTATFSIAAPLTNPVISTTTICEGGTFSLTANPTGGTAPYTYAWTGPGSFTSTDQNPVIASATLAHAGTYSLVVTDSCGAVSTVQSTSAITITAGTVPTFDAILPAICRDGFAPILVNQSTNGITGTWSPAMVSNTATGSYLFTPDAGQCAVPVSVTIFVVNNVAPAFNLPASICYNEPVPALPAVSSNGIIGTWNPAVINNLAGGTYVFTPNAGQCATIATRIITVNTIIPVFDPVPPICEDAPAPTLPMTSINGISGSWSPAAINTSATTTYTFTPNPMQCAPVVTLQVTVIPNVTAIFAPITPFCAGTAAAALPGISANGIAGTWNPAVIDNLNSDTYTFTPTLCGPPVTLNVTVLPSVIPEFETPEPICVGGIAAVLPLVSDNGITGTWSPAIVSNLATATYTFTPVAGVCAFPTTITVVVNPIVAPQFAAIPPICSGAAVPALPDTSINGIDGSWSPETISNTVSATYTFTPDTGECATPTTINVTITPLIAPLFPAVPPICAGDPAPILPLLSTNGISGIWDPAAVSNIETGTYTFTPDGAICASPTTLTVTVGPIETPLFSFMTTICAGAVPPPVLPIISDNGIEGTWSPAIADPNATATYTFTPTVGTCSVPLDVLITVEPIDIPSFDPVPPICIGGPTPALSSISNNGISGTWTPAVISNTVSAAYTFTPLSTECAVQAILNVTISPNILPLFDAVPPFCAGEPAPVLAAVSNNGITGSWSPAVVSNTASGVYTFTPDSGQCALPANISVTVDPIVAPAFSFPTRLCVDGIAPLLPLISDNGIAGTWSPAIVSSLATDSYTFTPTAASCGTPVIIIITVDPIVPPTFDPIAPICEGAAVPALPAVSNNGISGTWLPAAVSNTLSGQYTFTPAAAECATPVAVNVTIVPNIIPVFNPIAPICEGDTAPVLPLVSTNGITGTWNPAVVSNTTSAVYTFTADAGSCGLPATMNITVNPIVAPAFSFGTQLCVGGIAPLLPLISDNGIAGTWSPAIVSSLATDSYRFTPTAASCGTPVTIIITVGPIVTPTFDPIAPICAGAAVPALPAVSNNGISGTWLPAAVSNTLSGLYTFTPAAAECATPVAVNVAIVPNVIPVFNPIAPICEGDTAPVLPLVSTNGITGTWNPAVVSNTTSAVYTFTADTGSCGLPATISITVNPIVVPTFSIDTEFCEGEPAPFLPLISGNGITGAWSPFIVSNTSSGIYTFTPSPGLCASVVQLNVTVNPIVSPTFDAIPVICEGSAVPVLPTISNNGITGTWFPDIISNTISGPYVFTPLADECATPLLIGVTVAPNVLPLFDPVAPICAGDTAPVLPLISTNGISGTWSPATVSNTSTGVYTFTADPGICALPITIIITVDPVITPTFNIPSQLCEGDAAPVLPLISDNGIAGTWSPALVSNTASDLYTFTPVTGICADVISVSITVNPILTPTFGVIADFCEGTAAPVLSLVSTNGINGTWSPALVSNTASGTYNFTPAAGVCAVGTSVSITVIPNIVPVFDTMPAICSGAMAPVLPMLSNNGISGTWSPATVSNTATGIYTFTPVTGSCATPVNVTVTVIPILSPAFNLPSEICAGTPAPILPAVSDNGFSGSWSPATVSNTSSGLYTFTPDANQCSVPILISITVVPVVTPSFDPIGPICGSAPAPVLPTISNNGVSGTWSPSTVSTSVSGNYVFTPGAAVCATPITLSIAIVPVVTPVFDAIPAICAGDAAPVLPLTSNNGVVGSWSPATVDNMATATYVFTPSPEICASPVSITITVNPVLTPVFSVVTQICAGDFAPVLPPASDNGVSGSWTPAIVSNTDTLTYQFTPDSGVCATPLSLTITVSPLVLPAFNPIPPICAGSPPPALPLVSVNGIPGTWGPAIIDNTVSAAYTFTPDPGQCAVPVAILINVVPSITPVFDPLQPICAGHTAPVLPTVSNNGIAGSWNPAAVSNTTSGTYTFTPAAGICAPQVTLTMTVNPTITPVFNPLSPICNGGLAPTLQTVSNNGITGNWSPAVVSNTTSGIYTFTPDAGQCAIVTIVTFTVNPILTPTFSFSTNICAGSVQPALPSTSNNGVAGTWSPANIDINASNTYTFTPNAGECAVGTTVSVTVNPIITPLFDPVAALCSGSDVPTLPLTSLNGINGTWNPAVVSNSSTTTYTFTPDFLQCGTTATLEVVVYQSPNELELVTADVFNGAAAGTIEVASVGSGTAPFTYSINGGAFSAEDTFTNLLPGIYTVTVRDANGCEYSDTAEITSSCRVPKGISPNNDNDNDVLVVNGCSISSLELFNRYGTKVNSFRNYANNWDGTASNGEELPVGTYFYVAETQEGVKTGWIYLNR